MKVYAFDVDDTLEVSNGPVKLQSLAELRMALASGLIGLSHIASGHSHAISQPVIVQGGS